MGIEPDQQAILYGKIDAGRAIDEASRAIEKAKIKAREDVLREAAGWVAAFDQDQTGWSVPFERETVRRLADGLRAMADSAKARRETA
jgi:hypothetical protein